MASRKKTSGTKKNVQHGADTSISRSSSEGQTRQPVLRKVTRFIGWIIAYLVVFYLGNVTGEYVASHLPILPRLPRITWDASVVTKAIPKVNLSWPMSKTPIQPTSVPQVQMVIVNGQIVNMPLPAATDDQRKAFRELISGMAVNTTKVTVTNGCSLEPGFFRVKQGARIDVVNTTSTAYAFEIADSKKSIAQHKTTSVVFPQALDTYPLFCDGSVVGFYIVE